MTLSHFAHKGSRAVWVPNRELASHSAVKTNWLRPSHISAPLCCQPPLLRDFLAVVLRVRAVGCNVGFAGPGSG